VSSERSRRARPSPPDRLLQVLFAVAVQRARSVADQPRGHGRASDADRLVVSEPGDERHQFIRGLPDHVMLPSGLEPEGAKVGPAGIA
jgi:hypothetical protein